MIGEPWFWRERTLAAQAVSLALAPAALAYDAGQRLRAAATRPEPAPVPVFCVGNATVGGVGKTPFAMLLAERLAALGASPHFLTRGYGGALKGPVLVDLSVHDAAAVGDEALLLAAKAPAWVARDRPAGARAAAAGGARAIIMDDGFQNPTLEKTCAFLLVGGRDPFGNARVFPAGPLRESPSRAALRADALVIIAATGAGADADFDALPAKARLRAIVEPDERIAPGRVLAFCGIGGPERFFSMLETQGVELVARRPFPDHHRFSEAELAQLRREAERLGARLVATAKDFARLSPAQREGVDVLKIRMRIDDPVRLDALLLTALGRAGGSEAA